MAGALLAGYGYAALAALMFGVQYLPVKKYEIFDGSTFQFFMANGILSIGLVLSVVTGDCQHGIDVAVAAGGALWAVSNYAVLPLVKLLGIGLGFSLYHFVNLAMGYCVGRFGLFGVPAMVPSRPGDLANCDVGLALLLFSFVIALFVETGDVGGASKGRANPAHSTLLLDQDSNPDSCLDCENVCFLEAPPGCDKGFFDVPATMPVLHARLRDLSEPMLPQQKLVLPLEACSPETPPPTHQSVAEASTPTTISDAPPMLEALPQKKVSYRRKAAGIMLALVAGGFCGVFSVPATLYFQAHPDRAASAVVLSQCIGVWAAANFIYLINGFVAKLQGVKLRHANIRPAYLSGCTWAVGYILMLRGIKELGYSVGYVLDAVGPIAIAGFLSIVVFREMTGRAQIALYAASVLLQAAGVVLIAMYGSQ